MRIVRYSELRDKTQLYPLVFHGFGDPMDYRLFEERARVDSRFRHGLGLLCALERGKVIGCLAALKLLSRTLEGEAPVGGITLVITHPLATRRGVATALFEEAHAHFRDEGYLFSFLTTNSSWHAYDLYRKMGYEVVAAVQRYPMAYKLLEPKGELPPSRPVEERVAKSVATRIARLFARANAHRTGFSVRYDDIVQAHALRGMVDVSQSILREDGYALVRARSGFLEVREMVVLTSKVQTALLEALAGKGPRSLMDPCVPDQRLIRGYQRQGFKLTYGAHSVLMAKPLTDVSLVEAYGEDFYISPLEWF